MADDQETAGSSGSDGLFTAYENGKHRRYELLFAVNGGAFALAKLFHEGANGSPCQSHVLGRLSINQVALGMIVFTAIMFVDIFAFGRGMRRRAYDSSLEKQKWTIWTEKFTIVGLIVLFVISALICAAWQFVQDAFPLGPALSFIILFVAFFVCVGWYLALEKGLTRGPGGQVVEPKARCSAA